MTTSEDRVREAKLKATASALERTERARAAVATAMDAFSGTGDLWVAWGTLDDKLRCARPHASHYKDLQVALRDAEAALNRAESACAALTEAIRSQ